MSGTPSRQGPATLPDAGIRARSVLKYRKRAAGYDATCGPTWPIRGRTVAALRLLPGQHVLDVGCGTGLSLALLRDAVGENGRVFGFDQSPEMHAVACARVAATGWSNVLLFEAPAQALRLLDWHITPVQFGMGYIGIGRVAGHSAAALRAGAGP